MNANSDQTETSNTQTETSRSSGDGRFPPTKTAIATADGGSPSFSQGEKLECRVTGFRDGGFEVLILRDGITGFLKSNEQRKIGDVILAQFDCWQDGSFRIK
ncbi:MAG: hypothetical protein C0469_14555 [Cyanobacteria bacterium DS2.3.42]|nr:hypothetical protein [Cyanobacteria bacterium DS2.3.42]